MSRRHAGTGSSSVGRPDHVLLYKYGLRELAEDNSTTAYTFTEATKTIKVTVSIADLPSPSYFHVSCPDLQDSPFAESPEILWSSEGLVLFRVFLAPPGPIEFFLYRRAGRQPLLDLLHGVRAYIHREHISPYHVGVVPDGDGDGGGFVLAVFNMEWDKREYKHKLHVFRSKRRAWTKEHLAPDLPSWTRINTNLGRRGVTPDKVIALPGAVGYVDLWKGILLCNVLEEPVTARFIPLPNPLPGNQEDYGERCATRIRDVACADGLTITCVEMEDLYCSRARTPDVLHDCDVDPTEEKDIWVGWRLMTWYREVSWDYWRKGCVLHVDELGTVSLPPHPAARTEPLPPKHLQPSSPAEEFPQSYLEISCPVLCGEDVVCLFSDMDDCDHDACIVAIDMRKKAVTGMLPFYDKNPAVVLNPTSYISCTLKKYLRSRSHGGGSLTEDTRSHGKRRRSFRKNTNVERFDVGAEETI